MINELASAENGAVVFSSATCCQYALESLEWGNGAFTRGLVEGIEGKASYGGSGRITGNSLISAAPSGLRSCPGNSRPPLR